VKQNFLLQEGCGKCGQGQRQWSNGNDIRIPDRLEKLLVTAIIYVCTVKVIYGIDCQ